MRRVRVHVTPNGNFPSTNVRAGLVWKPSGGSRVQPEKKTMISSRVTTDPSSAFTVHSTIQRMTTVTTLGLTFD